MHNRTKHEIEIIQNLDFQRKRARAFNGLVSFSIVCRVNIVSSMLEPVPRAPIVAG